jgi:hypothetical protein
MDFLSDMAAVLVSRACRVRTGGTASFRSMHGGPVYIGRASCRPHRFPPEACRRMPGLRPEMSHSGRSQGTVHSSSAKTNRRTTPTRCRPVGRGRTRWAHRSAPVPW